MKIVFFSAHLYSSEKKAGFHKMAEASHQLGHEVVFVTSPISLLFNLRRLAFGKVKTDDRYVNLKMIFRNREQSIQPDFSIYTLLSIVHPVETGFKWSNQLLIWLYKLTSLDKLEGKLKQADVIIIESCAALFFVEKIKNYAPMAKFIYRVSDDLSMLRVPRQLINDEEKLALNFDLVSVPSPGLADKFADSNLVINFHGVDKELFKRKWPSPFSDKSVLEANGAKEPAIHALLLGGSFADFDSFEIMASLRPLWHFHYLGPCHRNFKNKNIIIHGIVPFTQTIAFLQHADIGLNCRLPHPKAKVLSHSLKILQYAFVGLPIVSPDLIEIDFKGAISYRIGNKDSISEALDKALKYRNENSQNPNRKQILDWKQTTEAVLKQAFEKCRDDITDK